MNNPRDTLKENQIEKVRNVARDLSRQLHALATLTDGVDDKEMDAHIRAVDKICLGEGLR